MGGAKADSRRVKQGEGGVFARHTLFNAATYQELLDCNQSEAHNFKKEWEEVGGGGSTRREGSRTQPQI